MKTSRIFPIFTLLLLLGVSFFGPSTQPALAGGGGVIFTVNSTGDGGDPLLNGICATTRGACTLRAAIQEANFDPNPNTIHFNLLGSGYHFISPAVGPLPAIKDALNLDASSQPNCTTPCIVLSGINLAGTNSGLVISGGSSSVKGFVIISFSSSGIWVNSSNNFIQGNVIGFLPGSDWPAPNGNGIALLGLNNTIGGTSAALRNVLSGNNYAGITVGNGSATTSGNLILGNFIGTDQTGMSARPNAKAGIHLFPKALSTTIGGTAGGSRNVISGNAGPGIRISGFHTEIQGNFIGTAADGNTSLGNAGAGIHLDGDAQATLIGGYSGAAQNRIAYNGSRGILVATLADRRTNIRRNSIFSNSSLGIDLQGNGVSSNDLLDGDSGPNELQNFPVVSSASSSTSTVIVRLYSEANSTYSIELFSSPAGKCDPSNYGEGKKFLGSFTATTDASGYVRVVYTSPVGFAAGSIITATATDSAGRTSEFSKCRPAG